jgi:hypothetical protein
MSIIIWLKVDLIIAGSERFGESSRYNIRLAAEKLEKLQSART